MKKRFTFAVNEVTTHNMREVGNHTPSEDTVTVEAVEQFTFSGKERHYDAGATENLARALARTELGERTPGVQAFQPGWLLKVEDVPTPVIPVKAPAKAPATQDQEAEAAS